MNTKSKEKKNNEKMLRYQRMEDHDILVTLGTKIEYIEESLATMNGAVKKQARAVSIHDTRITTMETTCMERSKTVFNRLDAASGSFRISKKLIGAAAGAVGAIVTVVYIIGKLFRWWG